MSDEIVERKMSLDRVYAADKPDGSTYLALYFRDINASCFLTPEEARALGAFLSERPASTSCAETEP